MIASRPENAKRPRRLAGPLASIDKWVWEFFYLVYDYPVEVLLAVLIVLIGLSLGGVI